MRDLFDTGRCKIGISSLAIYEDGEERERERIAQTLENLSAMLADLESVSEQVDFKMNSDKAKTMSNGHVVLPLTNASKSILIL